MDQKNSSISSFKNFLKRILFPFLIIVISLGTVINYYFERKIVFGSENSGVYKVNKIIKENNSDEIGFFGSSRAEGTFIPDSLVKNGFNYGLSGAQDLVTYFFVNEECKKKGKSSPIVISFDLDGLNNPIGDKSNYIYNSEYPPVKELLGSSYKNIFKFPFLKYSGYFEMYTKYYINDKLNLTRFTSKGASIERIETSKEFFNELISRELKSKRVFANEPKLVDEFSELFKSNPNRKFIIVIAPYHKSFFDGFTNIQDAELYLASIKKNPNVTVLDFGKIDFPNEYFFDTRHLNLKGAIVFNRILKDSLNVIMAK